MRPPSDMPQTPRPATHRRRRWIIVAVVVLIVLFVSLKTFAIFYTDALWFSSVNLHSVWVKLFEIKVGLIVTFAAIFAVMLLASLIVAERLAPKGPTLDAEDEFVKRYQEVIGPYSRWLRVGVVIVLALIVGSQAIGQWNNWILFRNSSPSESRIRSSIATSATSCSRSPSSSSSSTGPGGAVRGAPGHLFSHYLNGGIRMQGSGPRVRPAVKAHISVILGLMALVKAVGYYLARFNLDLSNNGYVQGAGYTDVHARLPALELLILVSVAAAVLLIYNIRRQGWALPDPRCRAVVPGGPHRRHHLPGRRPGAQGKPGAEHAGTSVHPAEHRRHPGGHGHQQRPDHRLPGVVKPHRHRSCRPTATRWPSPPVGSDPDPAHLPQAPGHPLLLPVQHAGDGPIQGQRRGDPRHRRRPGDQRRTISRPSRG